MLEIVTHSADETRRIGELFAAILRVCDTVALIGELGSGKTVFVSGTLLGLGYDGQVTSPTFTLVHEYKAASIVYHIDCFRLLTMQDFQSSGMEDYLEAEGVVFAEWGDRIADQFNDWSWEVRFDFVNGDENERRIGFLPGRGEQSLERFKKLRTFFAGSVEVTS